MKAYRIIHEYYPDTEVVAVAETAGKAKYSVWLNVADIVSVSPSFTMSCKRAPEYDCIAKDYSKATVLPKYDTWDKAADAIMETHKLLWSKLANAS